MGTYVDRFFRKLPPRDTGLYGTTSPIAGQVNPPAAPGVRVLACNNATTSVELDNDIFQLTPPANTPGSPGSVGRMLVQLQNEDTSNAVYVLFGAASTVAANSAATSGNTMCELLRVNGDATYEIDPAVDKWMSVRTKNGVSGTATVRYRIVSFPNSGAPGAG